MPLITHYLPESEGMEKLYIQDLIEEMSHEQAQLFATVSRKKKGSSHRLAHRDCRTSCCPGSPAFLAWPNGNGLSLLIHLGTGFGWFNNGSRQIQEASLQLQSKSRTANSR